MAELLSLKELKAQNAEVSELNEDLPVDDKKEVIKDEYIEVDKQIEAATDKVEPEKEGLTKAEVESWMQTDEAETSEDDQTSGFVPNEKYANRRKNTKALKGELNDTKDENEELRARLAALESGNAPQAPVVDKLPPRPTREQFEYDDDKYDVAIDEWNDKKFDLKLKTHNQTSQTDNQKQQQQEAQQESQRKNLDDHYGRAQKLVEDGKVTSESYQKADLVVRRSLESISPGNGDNMANTLISTLNALGAGSEKVMFQLGVNPKKMQELQDKLVNDPSGLSASAFLGQLQSQVQTPSTRRSQTPKPGAKVEGEGGAGGKLGTLQKQYSKLTEPQDRISFKRKAKKEGVDVSQW